MPDFKSIAFKMAVIQGAGRICPPHVCVIQKTPRGIGLKFWNRLNNLTDIPIIVCTKTTGNEDMGLSKAHNFHGYRIQRF